MTKKWDTGPIISESQKKNSRAPAQQKKRQLPAPVPKITLVMILTVSMAFFISVGHQPPGARAMVGGTKGGNKAMRRGGFELVN